MKKCVFDFYLKTEQTFWPTQYNMQKYKPIHIFRKYVKEKVLNLK